MTRCVLVALVATLGTMACRGEGYEPPPGVLSVSVEQTSAWVRNFNPLAPGQPRWPTQAGVYEPMMIYNTLTSEWVPWLATGYAWSADGRSLTMTIRDGVRWSDGEPFDADDVRFTFELLRTYPVLDQRSVWSFLAGVRVVDDGRAVQFDFERVYVPGLGDVAQQAIVAEHVWSQVDDPMTFTNPEPVGTGPFTEVVRFQNQVYELGRNPHYWQPGRPQVERLRFLAYPSNDQANMALVEGAVDWAGNFVPAVERTWRARDPEHNHFWFPLLGSTVFLYANTTRPPFDDANVRRALSLAINRERVVEIAMYGYTEPAHPSGLNDAYGSWRHEVPAADDWVRYDPDEARRLLDEAGWRPGPDGVRVGPSGERMTYRIDVVSGWTDWVRAGQVIARDLEAIGVDATLHPSEFGAWFADLQRGQFDLAISWSQDGATPYGLFKWLMSPRSVAPIGEASAANWHRFGDPQLEPLLEAFETTVDEAEQRALAAQMQDRFVATAPAIPLFANPMWAEYSTARFEGFPTPDDPYAKPSPNAVPECLLVMTRLRPRTEATP